jgi:hypothetical protein
MHTDSEKLCVKTFFKKELYTWCFVISCIYNKIILKQKEETTKIDYIKNFNYASVLQVHTQCIHFLSFFPLKRVPVRSTSRSLRLSSELPLQWCLH